MNQYRKSLEMLANLAEGYDRNSRDPKQIEILANKYVEACDNGDETAKSVYISALTLKFWDNVGRMQEICKTANFGNEDDFASHLYYCIQTACDYRKWLDPEAKTTAKACINQAIATRGAPEIMYYANRDSAKVNCGGNYVSFDAPYGDDEDSLSYEETTEDESSSGESVSSYIRAKMMVESCIKSNKVVEAIILDNIAFGDSYREVKEKAKMINADGEEVKYDKYHREFWEYGLVRDLESLDSSYADQFKSRYDVNPAIFDAAFSKIKSVDSTKLHKFVKNTLKMEQESYSGVRI